MKTLELKTKTTLRSILKIQNRSSRITRPHRILIKNAMKSLVNYVSDSKGHEIGNASYTK